MSKPHLDFAGQGVKQGSSSSPKLPSRGSVLCIFDDPRLVETIEPAIIEEGFTILRARHGMHGYWMAITGAPNVIVADIAEPERESNYLMDCLARNVKTREIPLIALVDATRQTSAAISCLRHATVCLNKHISAPELLQQIRVFADHLGDRQLRCDAPEADRVDAFFSQLGHKSRSTRVVAKMLKNQQAQGERQ